MSNLMEASKQWASRPPGLPRGEPKESPKMARGFLAVTKAPTTERPHRIVSAEGRTEADALLNLTTKLVALGASKSGEIEVIPLNATEVK